METKKREIIFTGIITAVSLALCVVFYFNDLKQKLLYDLSLACFGSALLGLVVAYTNYSTERDNGIRSFYSEVMRVVNDIVKIQPIHFLDYTKEPDEYRKYSRNQSNELSALYVQYALKHYDSEYKASQSSTADAFRSNLAAQMDGIIECRDSIYRSEITQAEKAYRSLISKGYTLFHEYEQLDFLFPRRKLLRLAENIYLKLDGFIQRSSEEDVTELNSTLFRMENDKIYASFVDDIVKQLDQFWSKAYHKKEGYLRPTCVYTPPEIRIIEIDASLPEDEIYKLEQQNRNAVIERMEKV